MVKRIVFGCSAEFLLFDNEVERAPHSSAKLRGLLSPSGTMITAMPGGISLNCGSVTIFHEKNSLPAVFWRGPETGVLRRENDFHGPVANRIDSCLFLQNLFLKRFIAFGEKPERRE